MYILGVTWMDYSPMVGMYTVSQSKMTFGSEMASIVVATPCMQYCKYIHPSGTIAECTYLNV